MESFEMLEKKIGQLVGIVQSLKNENAGLKKKISVLEKDLSEGSTNIKDLSAEREKTKDLVVSLIKNIDQFVGNN